ncbi:hypothetical protein GJAV_G00140990 [Gymnothorax javanicus]|nr:hypothetical protein GJAV_G00140990 [Gymnothorax javanicus]
MKLEYHSLGCTKMPFASHWKRIKLKYTHPGTPHPGSIQQENINPPSARMTTVCICRQSMDSRLACLQPRHISNRNSVARYKAPNMTANQMRPSIMQKW